MSGQGGLGIFTISVYDRARMMCYILHNPYVYVVMGIFWRKHPTNPYRPPEAAPTSHLPDYQFVCTWSSLLFGSRPLDPPLLRTVTQLWARGVLLPVLVHLDIPDHLILRTLVKEVHPMLKRIMNLLLGLGTLFSPHTPELFSRDVPIRLRVVDRQEHLLHSAHVRRTVVGEAARDISPTRIYASEKVVGAARTIGATVGRHVVDGAVDGEVDGLRLVGAVVGG